MALVLEATTGGAQGIQNRLGAIYSAQKIVDTYAGTTVPGKIQALQVLFDGCSPAVRASIADVFNVQADLQGVDSSGLAALAAEILIDMVHANNPLPDLTLPTAMAEFIRELKAQDYKVASNTVSATVTQSGLVGNGTVVVSTKNPQGYELQNLIQEDLEVRVESATELRVRGQADEAGLLDHNWPTGSGADESYAPVIADSSDSLVTNGSFDLVTANAPDDWNTSGATPGTTLDDEAVVVYRSGGKSVKFIGNGAENTTIYQDLVAVLEPHKQYAIAFVCKVDSNPAAGAITVDLHDGSSVINDEAGTANSLAFSITALGTDWVWKTVSFRTPDPLPAACRLRIRASTAITSSRVFYLDDLTVIEMRQPSGDDRTPYAAFPDGSIPYSVDDNAADGTGTFKIAVANNFTSAIQKAFQRHFDMVGLRLQLPITGTNTLDASLFS